MEEKDTPIKFNRRSRRAMKEAEESFNQYIAWIEQQFINHLFADNDYTYRRLFEIYNRAWKKIGHWFNKKFGKLFELDLNYFYNTYLPLEG